ncbi:MAG: phosphopyruvate hydratase [Ignavibacteria bacterium]|nr:phosphopyruvate hydratase [Ignavibacteria bacterium]
MKNYPTIEKVTALEILDSRGNPTIEVEVVLSNGIRGRAAAPSGASTGENEAVELRDNENPRYFGRGVLKAVNVVNQTFNEKLGGLNSFNQSEIDRMLVELDGTQNKSRLGGNSIVATSMAIASASANYLNVPLFRYIGGISARILPVPLMNILNGGKHADNNVDIQEFMIVPAGANSFAEALRMGTEVYHTLKSVLKKKGYSTAVGDEGGFAPSLKSNEEAIEVILEAINNTEYKAGKEIFLALDVAASEMYEDGKYRFFKSTRELFSSDEMIKWYAELINKYPIVSIEDGLGERDWEAWVNLTKEIGRRVQLVGDDIFVTNIDFLRKGIELGVANSILIKLNQIGTVTEALQTIELARQNGYTTIISHRSGETEDTFIADFSVGTSAGQIKTGAPCRTDRLAKYNQLLRIEKELGANAFFAGLSQYKGYIQ